MINKILEEEEEEEKDEGEERGSIWKEDFSHVTISLAVPTKWR